MKRIPFLGKNPNRRRARFYLYLYDQDRAEKQDFWFDCSNHQTVNYDVLVSTPEFDSLIRHPKVMEPLNSLMKNDICFSEIGLQHMAAYIGDPKHWGWYRDGGHLIEHPLRMKNIQLIVYLSNVDETTHCFSVSPESVKQPILDDREAQLKQGGICNLYGDAGTAVFV